MEQRESKFQQLILDDRSSREMKSWRGKFLEYLDLIKENPDLAKLSHARLYDVILDAGSADIHDLGDLHAKRLFKDESFKVYRFFADEFFGIEKTIASITRYFHSAALKGEESRQVLYHICESWNRNRKKGHPQKNIYRSR